MKTECKPKKTVGGDYTYRGAHIIKLSREYLVGHRGNNGHMRYRRFKTLKAACMYIDGTFDWACE